VAAERRLRVDWPACKAHGVCAELVPELVTLDEWGYPLIEAAAVPRSVLAHAQRAVTACPTLALSLVVAPEQPASGRRRH
jgi:ferredoxin